MRRLALGLVLVLALAACGEEERADPPKERPIDALAAAAAKSAAAGTVRMSGTMDMTTGGERVALEMTGVADLRANASATRTEVANDSKRQAGFPQEMVMADSKQWMSSPEIAANLPKGRRWTMTDLAQVWNELGLDPDRVARTAAADPVEMMRTLGKTGQARRVGVETIDGVRTTRYAAAIDIRKALEAARTRKGADVDKAIAGMAGLLGNRMPVEVWVGPDGLIHRQKLEFRMQSGIMTGGGTATIDMTDYGADVTIEPPAGKDVVDVTEQIKAVFTRAFAP